jgi:putative transposase
VSKRVSPTERIRAEIDELFAAERDLASTLEDVARLTVRLMMQTAIDAAPAPDQLALDTP